MNIKCAITGATGFIGQNLIPYLGKRNYLCYSISRKQLNGIQMQDFEYSKIVIHLAGKAHDVKKSSNPEEYYQVNFELTKQAYDAFLKSDAEKFIFLSSVKAAADQVDGILTEDITPNPQTDYGKSKLMAEQYIQSQPLPEGKFYYILRPCMIHGPGNKGNLNLLYQVVKRGIPYPLTAFDNKRSFISIQNLCFIIEEIINRNDIPSGIYHVSDDKALSTSEVVSILAQSMNKSPLLWRISPNLIKFFARIGDTFHLPLTTERLEKLTESYMVSNAKIKHAIDKPLPLNVKEGLELTANSFNKV